jgi:MFS family permease
MLLSSLVSGTLVDRFGRRRTSVVSDLLSALSAAAIPLVAVTGDLTFGWVLALAVLGSVFDPAGVTARESMLPDVASAAHLPLQRVNGIHEAVWGLAYLIGPAVGGLLIGVVGAVDALWLLSAGFLASSVLLALVRVPGAGRPRAADRPAMWAGTLDGLRFVWRDPVLRSVTLLSTAFVAIAYPVLGVVLPYVFEQLDQPERLGVLLMAFSLGSIVGALAYSGIGHRVHQRAAFVVGMAGNALVLAFLAWSPPFEWLVVGAVVGGLSTGPVNPIVNFVLQERTPDTLRGRVMGVLVSIAYGVVPLGYLLAGVLVERIGAGATLAGAAGAGACVVVATIRSRDLRGMDTHVARLEQPAGGPAQRESAGLPGSSG